MDNTLATAGQAWIREGQLLDGSVREEAIDPILLGYCAAIFGAIDSNRVLI